jgi:hypothetical protein
MDLTKITFEDAVQKNLAYSAGSSMPVRNYLKSSLICIFRTMCREGCATLTATASWSA